jgi:hypothetical protein
MTSSLTTQRSRLCRGTLQLLQCIRDVRPTVLLILPSPKPKNYDDITAHNTIPAFPSLSIHVLGNEFKKEAFEMIVCSRCLPYGHPQSLLSMAMEPV